MYGDGEPAARMLRAAVDAYGWSGDGLVDAMLEAVQSFQAVVAGDRGAEEWGARELAHMERNADLFRRRLGAYASYRFMRNPTWYFVTDVRWPGVSLAGIAFNVSSPRR
jgi:hypothetical protein